MSATTGTITPWIAPTFISPVEGEDVLYIQFRQGDRWLTVYTPFAAMECFTSEGLHGPMPDCTFAEGYRWLVADETEREGKLMAKYRKRPVVIEAVQFDPQSHPWPEGVVPWREDEPRPRDMSWGYIQTLEGRMHVIAGDWIITGVAGEKYPCKDAIFRATYEPVGDR